MYNTDKRILYLLEVFPSQFLSPPLSLSLSLSLSSQFIETKVLCDKISNAKEKEFYFKRIYSDKNIEQFKSLLQTTDWNSMFKGNISVNERYDNFVKKNKGIP